MTLGKPTDAQLTTEFPHFTPMKIHYHIHAQPPLTPLLSKYAPSLHPPIKIHLHISLPSMYMSSKWFLLLQVFLPRLSMQFSLPDTLYALPTSS